MKSRASDRLGDLVPYGSSQDFSRVFFTAPGFFYMGICLEIFFHPLRETKAFKILSMNFATCGSLSV